MFVSELSLLACSAPWLSDVFSELKPGLPLIVFSRIRRRVHDTKATEMQNYADANMAHQFLWGNKGCFRSEIPFYAPCAYKGWDHPNQK